MKMKYFDVLIFMLAVFVGCKPLPPPEPAKQEPKSAVPEIEKMTLSGLENHDVKVVRNDDGSLKSIDYTPMYEADFAASLKKPDRILASADEIRSVRVVRGSRFLSDARAAELACAPRLTELLWTDATVLDAGLQTLASLGELKKLRLTNFHTEHAPRWAEILATYPALADLDISGSEATDADMIALAGAPKLTKLNLYQTKVSDAGVANLLPLAGRLTSLNLDATLLTDEGVKTLEGFEKLTFLHLGRTAITDGAAESLGKITSLEKLHVTRTKMTEQGFAVLKEKLPNTEIVTEVEEKE